MLGADGLGLHSKKIAELSAGETVKITAPTLDVKVDGAIKVASVPGKAAEGTIDVDAEKAIKVTSKTADIALTADAAATQNVFIKAGKVASAKAGDASLELDVVETANLLAGAWGLKIDGAAQQATLGGPAMKLTIKADQVALGESGGMNGLLTKSDMTNVHFATSVVKVSASGVDLVGTVIKANGRCLLG